MPGKSYLRFWHSGNLPLLLLLLGLDGNRWGNGEQKSRADPLNLFSKSLTEPTSKSESFDQHTKHQNMLFSNASQQHLKQNSSNFLNLGNRKHCILIFLEIGRELKGAPVVAFCCHLAQDYVEKEYYYLPNVWYYRVHFNSILQIIIEPFPWARPWAKSWECRNEYITMLCRFIVRQIIS